MTEIPVCRVTFSFQEIIEAEQRKLAAALADVKANERTLREGWSQTVEQEIERRMYDTIERTCAVEIRARKEAQAEVKALGDEVKATRAQVRRYCVGV